MRRVECSPSRRWLVDGYELCASRMLEVVCVGWRSEGKLGCQMKPLRRLRQMMEEALAVDFVSRW
jgi:hypothetical protein